jgi:RNA polymerase sigma factor (sigma-70 family)
MADRSIGRQRITALLLAWQETADERHLQRVFETTRRLMERVARSVLVRFGIADASAVDDAVSLVLDHLRRLPGASDQERAVASFRPRSDADDVDPGENYIVWLTTERTKDVIRARRRRQRMTRTLSSVAGTRRADALSWPAATGADEEAVPTDCAATLETMLARLEPSAAMVIRMLLAGKSQKAIATALGVCEGTISRQRARAIERLRSMLPEGG